LASIRDILAHLRHDRLKSTVIPTGYRRSEEGFNILAESPLENLVWYRFEAANSEHKNQPIAFFFRIRKELQPLRFEGFHSLEFTRAKGIFDRKVRRPVKNEHADTLTNLSSQNVFENLTGSEAIPIKVDLPFNEQVQFLLKLIDNRAGIYVASILLGMSIAYEATVLKRHRNLLQPTQWAKSSSGFYIASIRLLVSRAE
jgi:hypothetical protein